MQGHRLRFEVLHKSPPNATAKGSCTIMCLFLLQSTMKSAQCWVVRSGALWKSSVRLTQYVNRLSKGYVKTRLSEDAPKMMLYALSCRSMPKPRRSCTPRNAAQHSPHTCFCSLRHQSGEWLAPPCLLDKQHSLKCLVLSPASDTLSG